MSTGLSVWSEKRDTKRNKNLTFLTLLNANRCISFRLRGNILKYGHYEPPQLPSPPLPVLISEKELKSSCLKKCWCCDPSMTLADTRGLLRWECYTVHSGLARLFSELQLSFINENSWSQDKCAHTDTHTHTHWHSHTNTHTPSPQTAVLVCLSLF